MRGWEELEEKGKTCRLG